MIYGLAESTDKNQDESVLISTLCVNGLKCNVAQNDIEKAFRLGRPRAPEEKPRPMKVFFKNSATRSQVLEKSKSLSRFPIGHSFRKVFIRPDWTKLQRDADFKRRQNNKNLNNHRSAFNQIPTPSINNGPTGSQGNVHSATSSNRCSSATPDDANQLDNKDSHSARVDELLSEALNQEDDSTLDNSQ